MKFMRVYGMRVVGFNARSRQIRIISAEKLTEDEALADSNKRISCLEKPLGLS